MLSQHFAARNSLSTLNCENSRIKRCDVKCALEGDWVELTFAKPSGTLIRDLGKNVANREEKSLRHVPMVAKFLDDNKRNFLGLNPKGPY